MAAVVEEVYCRRGLINYFYLKLAIALDNMPE